MLVNYVMIMLNFHSPSFKKSCISLELVLDQLNNLLYTQLYFINIIFLLDICFTRKYMTV